MKVNGHIMMQLYYQGVYMKRKKKIYIKLGFIRL
jgi:hypothetical protein